MRRTILSVMVAMVGWGVGAEEAVFRRPLDRVASLDPADCASIYAARAVMLAYETLLEYDYAPQPYRLVPGLAGAMPEVSADGKVYTLRLRESARFHPDPCFSGAGATGGRLVTARDVVFSCKRLADRKLASSGAWLVEDVLVGMRDFAAASAGEAPTDYSRIVAGVTALDDRTVRFELVRAVPQFLWYLAMPYLAIVPEEAVRCYGGAFGDHAVGSGPYRLKSWRRNYEMVFARNEAWPGWQGVHGRPFDRIVYVVMDDVSTQWLCFLGGQLDFLGEVSRDNWDAVIDPAGGLSADLRARGIRLHSLAALDALYVGFNMDDPVVGRNKKLRQALNCAFDARRWADFYNNRVIPLDGPIPPGIDDRSTTPFAYAYDPEKASRLLAEAGYPGGIDPVTGRRLQLAMDIGRANQDMRESTELMVAFFARVGIDLKPQYHSWPAFLKKVGNRQSQLFRIGWVGDYPDAENFMQMFVSRNLPPGPNRTCYVNSEADRLFEAAMSASDAVSRRVAWQAMQDIVREDCPWIFTHCNKAYSLTGPRVDGYLPHDFPYGMEKHLRVRSGR